MSGVAHPTGSSADLSWLLDDLVERVDMAERAIVLSADGLLVAASRGYDPGEAEHLAAVTAGIQSLARGAGERFGGGDVRQSIVEMESACLLVTTAGTGSCLAVLSAPGTDLGLLAYEMTHLITAVRRHFDAPPRSGQAAETTP